MPIFNEFLWNTRLWNGAVSPSDVYPTDLAIFIPGDFDDLLSLSDNVLHHVEEIEDNGHKVELTQHSVVRGPGVEVTDRNDREKMISITGWMEADTYLALEAAKDEMRRILSYRNGYLDLTRAGVVRRYEATLVNAPSMFSGWRSSMSQWSPWVLQFYCRDYGSDRSYTSDTPTDLVSASPATFTVEYAGSAPGRRNHSRILCRYFRDGDISGERRVWVEYDDHGERRCR